MKTIDPTESILNKIRQAGYEGGKFIANDRETRVYVKGDKDKQKSGTIKLAHVGDAVIGWFRNHRSGETIKLGVPTNGKRISHAELAQMHRDMEIKRIRENSEAAERATRTWHNADAVNPNHPYIVKKGIRPISCRQYNDSIIIPAIDTSKRIKTIQFINPQGEKFFMVGGAKRGHFCPLAPIKDELKVVLCEGWATGCSILMATGLPVIVAFDASNLVPVAESLQTLHSTKEWLICADNDIYTEGNPGRLAAEKAAMAIRRKGGRGRVILPGFLDEHPCRPTDANDLHRLYGLDALRSLILG